jgi:hypothetical protein
VQPQVQFQSLAMKTCANCLLALEKQHKLCQFDQLQKRKILRWFMSRRSKQKIKENDFDK